MDDDLEDFLDFLERDDPIQLRIEKRYIRDFQNPFEQYYDTAFRKRYRFDKDVVKNYILPIIEEDLQIPTRRGLPVPPILQLIMSLRFYASGNYQEYEFQTVTGDLRGFSQATVCNAIRAVSVALASKMNQFVHFPNGMEEQYENMRLFHKVAGMSNVIGCIDGTLIKIRSPSKAIGEVFRCRKGYFAINMMAVCGPMKELLYFDVRHPGSMHDNTCYERSALRIYLENNIVPGLLLGDNGYACSKYLLTPLLRTTTPAQRAYNAAHKKTRICVECMFGIMKKVFSCLARTLLNRIDNVVAIICAIAVLYNIRNIITRNIDDTCHHEDNHEYFYDNHINGNGLDFRREYIIRHFE